MNSTISAVGSFLVEKRGRRHADEGLTVDGLLPGGREGRVLPEDMHDDVLRFDHRLLAEAAIDPLHLLIEGLHRFDADDVVDLVQVVEDLSLRLESCNRFRGERTVKRLAQLVRVDRGRVDREECCLDLTDMIAARSRRDMGWVIVRGIEHPLHRFLAEELRFEYVRHV
jgi:hypothetical protein